MTHTIKTMDDLRWFLSHTQGFRGGHITDVHLAKRRIFDEESGQEVLAGNTVTVVVRYPAEGIVRVAKLTMQGVSDLSILEQEGADSSPLGVIQVEFNEGSFRFWFDPHGELYVVCEEALLEEVSLPQSDADVGGAVAQWTFQADCGEAPTVAWLLSQLDQAGAPCIWKAAKSWPTQDRVMCWEGELVAGGNVNAGPAAAVEVQIYGPIDGAGFGMRMRLHQLAAPSGGRLLNLVTGLVTQSFAGTCLMGQMFFSHDDWASWKSLGRASQARS